jgi:hypothetical protein
VDRFFQRPDAVVAPELQDEVMDGVLGNPEVIDALNDVLERIENGDLQLEDIEERMDEVIDLDMPATPQHSPKQPPEQLPDEPVLLKKPKSASGRLKGGRKRSRTPMEWQGERQRLINRLNDLDAINTGLIQEQDDVVRDELPELPGALLGDNPAENYITKYEIFSEYIESEQQNRDFDFPALEAQGLLEDALQWINTIPVNIIRTSIVRDRRRDELREQMDEIEEEIEELDDTVARENTIIGDEDSGTEMEGYGRRLKGRGQYQIPSQEYQPRRFL